MGALPIKTIPFFYYLCFAMVRMKHHTKAN